MKLISNKNGFTYIFVLTVVMIMGIMLGMVGQSWKTIKQRELEEEMIFRGDQVAELVYQLLLYKNSNLAPNTVNLFLWPINSPKGTILDELVDIKTETFGNKPPKKFRLRPSAAIDPMTNKQWQIVKPVGDVTRFAGVMSESTDEPFKKSFKNIYDSNLLDEKKQYSDWLFTWELKKSLP
ncbi:MAG: type II secretion system protein [Desulfuromonadaceae bacterium]